MQDSVQKFLWLIIPLIVWSIAWKGVALWTSARRGQKWWFIAFLVVNTVGALEILYLLVLGVPKTETRPAVKS
ncbi:MAG TPA: DUF5652 family protein [Patescibacteria group bacterium]|nr:DUF5652 family protein [Patescibacteria group bacterium]